MPMPDEYEEGSGGDDLEEVAALASAAFPKTEVDAAALKDLIRHCMADYGDDEPPKKDAGLAIVMGPPPKK